MAIHNSGGFSANAPYGNGLLTLNTTGLLPIVNNGLPNCYNAGNAGGLGTKDAYLMEFNNGGQILWSTFFGGTQDENKGSPLASIRNDLVINDVDDDIYIAGTTHSTQLNNFPLVSNNVSTGQNDHVMNGTYDSFIAKFDKNRNLVWSTYVGGNSGDIITGLSIGNTNQLYTVGYTYSTNYFTTAATSNSYSRKIFNGNFIDGFITIYNGSSLSEIKYSTYFGSVSSSNLDNENKPTSVTAYNYFNGFESVNNFLLVGRTDDKVSFPFKNFIPNTNVDYFYTQLNLSLFHKNNGFITLMGTVEVPPRMAGAESNTSGNFNAYYNNGEVIYKTNNEKAVQTMELYDMSGRCLLQDKATKSLNIKLTEGCYLIRAIYDDGASEVCKFIAY